MFPPMMVVMGVGLMFGSGAAAVISHTLGEGDGEKANRQLKEAAASMLGNSLNHSAEGNVKFSVFGKAQEGRIHLLFSVRFTPDNDEPAGLEPGRKAAQAEPDLDLKAAGDLLAALGSELKSVRSADRWKDVYFEIDQRTAEGEKQ